MAEKKVEHDETPQERFERIVMAPLRRQGMKEPGGAAGEGFADALAEFAEEFGGRSNVELDALRRRLQTEGRGRDRRILPAVVTIRDIAAQVLRARIAETGGESAADRVVIEGVLRCFQTRGQVPPPSLYNLSRRCRIVAILRSEGGPSAEELHRAGHHIPEDLRTIGAWA